VYTQLKKIINISSSRICSSPEEGGLGMFNLTSFFRSQMCVWIGRAYWLPIDNWQIDLLSLAPGNDISLIRPTDVPVGIHPILHNIVLAYYEFYGCFSGCDSNYLEAYIFDNPVFKWGPHYITTINSSSFGQRFYDTYKEKIRSLKFSDCFNNMHFKDPRQFREEGLPLTPAVWMQLRASLLRTRQLLTNRNLNNKCVEIGDFLRAGIKGSKRYRRFFEKKTYRIS
jgi:hypothetical protein